MHICSTVSSSYSSFPSFSLLFFGELLWAFNVWMVDYKICSLYVIVPFRLLQWEALALLLIGISVNQLRSLPEGSSAMGLPVATAAYLYTLIFVSPLEIICYLIPWIAFSLSAFIVLSFWVTWSCFDPPILVYKAH